MSHPGLLRACLKNKHTNKQNKRYQVGELAGVELSVRVLVYSSSEKKGRKELKMKGQKEGRKRE